MLLETALADFSTDEPQVFEDEQSGVGIQWDTRLNNSNSALKSDGVSNSDPVAGPAEIKRVYLDVKLPPSGQSSGDLSITPHQSRPLSDFLGMSRSPPAVDIGPAFEISRVEEHSFPQTGKVAHPRRTQSLNRGGKNIFPRSDGKTLHKVVSFTEDAGRFAWEELPGKPRLQRRSSAGASSTQQARQAQIPHATRVISMFKNERGVSPSSASSQNKEYRKDQLQQGRVPFSPKPGGVSPIRQSTRVVRPSGDSKQIKRPNSLKTPSIVHSRLENHLNRNDAELIDNSISSDYKYYEEESPVSILQRPPSPPTNSSGSSGSSVHSPPLITSSTISAPPLPGVSLARRRLPSFSSSSAQDSPRASTSSSNLYMSHCLAALQAALAIDPEKSKRFEESFVELDTYVEGNETRNFAKSPIEEGDDLLCRSGLRDSPAWARGGATRGGSELDPEYHTMDFYTDSEEENDGRQYHNNGLSASSSLARSSSGNSLSGPIRRSLNYPPVSVADYSSKDRRLLSSHPSSWVEHGDDSISSSLTNSKCNTLTRHQEVPWDEQQADLDAGKVEEVVRGAVDGLRFTYSPVSSAFVFTRPSPDGDEEAVSGRKGHVSYRSPHHRTFTDSEASRRFSVDYETSLCSEDSMSFARGSEVTELGMSRAESWSKVARGIAYQQGYQDAVPSSFIKRAGHGNMFEDANNGNSSAEQSPRFHPGASLGDHIAADSQLVRKRPVKKSGMTTCLPFRSILRNFRTIGSPGRSRLGMTPKNGDRQMRWTMAGPSPGVSRITY